MKAKVFSDEEALITKAIAVLIKELGPVETSRFLTLPKSKRMDSVKRHRAWQTQLQQKEFFDDIFRPASKRAARR